jgi:hypothetical protein
MAAQIERSEAAMAKHVIEIPESIRREHEAIHSALVAATRAPGRVGIAAKALADVLHPHFVREEEIALHARTEEEVLYPAALLVGDVLRARRPQR